MRHPRPATPGDRGKTLELINVFLEDSHYGRHSPPPMRLMSSDQMVGVTTVFVALAAFSWGLSGGIGGILAGNVTPVAAGAGLLSGLSYAVFIFGFKFRHPTAARRRFS